METILYKQKIDLLFENKAVPISSDLFMNEVELEIQVGNSLLNKTIIIKFYGTHGEEAIWPFHFSECNVKRISDCKETYWPINNFLIDSNGCENNSIFISIYKNGYVFRD